MTRQMGEVVEEEEMMNMKIDGNSWLLRCTGKMAKTYGLPMPTEAASNAFEL